MSNTARIAATAANTLVKPLDVSDVFSTYLYTGTSSALTITNGIDLAGEGGLVWLKGRSTGGSYTYGDHELFDTETEGGAAKYLNSARADALAAGGGSLVNGGFNSDGFSLKTGAQINNRSGDTTTSWTFRKAPKFFDVQTWTGTGGARTISHSLNTTVGTIIVKQTNASNNWFVYHRSLSTGLYPDAEDNFLMLNQTNAANDTTLWNSTAPTSTDFTVSNTLNTSSNTYVAYLFAHNDGDGDFGDGSQDIIKCGSYTGNGSATGPSINLGFEPQWLLIKGTSSTDSWAIFDVMRGMTVGASDSYLFPNSSGAELSYSSIVKPTPTGFQLESVNWNTNGNNYIYIAIRRGPMAVPTAGTDVFAIDTQSGGGEPSFTSGFVVDMGIESLVSSASNRRISSRLTQGKALETNTSDADLSSTGYAFDYQNGWFYDGGSNADKYSWMWKRAPNYFDVVTYSGTGVARTISHNLGAVPEMMWVKSRTNTRNWAVYHKGADASPESGLLRLDISSAFATGITTWDNTQPTASVFSVGTRNETNNASETFIAYLFASLDGISKVGSYTGNGTSQTIDCGFSSGARFVLIKATSVAYGWMLFDTERGITSGNDSLLVLNDIDAETTAFDSVDPYSSGFTAVQGPYNVNQSGVEYIFYAIA